MPERLWLLWAVARMIWSRDYARARNIVADVATDTRLYAEKIDTKRRGQEAVMAYFSLFAGAQEDVIRHAEARRRFFVSSGSTAMSNLLIELAYKAYRERN